MRTSAIIALIVLTASCCALAQQPAAAPTGPDQPALQPAPSPNPAAQTVQRPGTKQPGFFSGLMHGLWSPAVALFTLFTNKLPLIHFPNRGFLYNLGFLLGVASIVLLVRRLIVWRLAARRRKRGEAEPAARAPRSAELIRWVDEDGLPVARSFEDLAETLAVGLNEALEEQIVLHKLDDSAAEDLLQAGGRALRRSLANHVERSAPEKPPRD